MLIMSYLTSHLTPLELDGVGLELEPRVFKALVAGIFITIATLLFLLGLQSWYLAEF